MGGRRRYDPDRVLAAEVSGTALAHVQVGRLTREQALADIAELIHGLDDTRRVEVLARAATLFVADDAYPHQQRAAALVAEAGGNLGRARQMLDEVGARPFQVGKAG